MNYDEMLKEAMRKEFDSDFQNAHNEEEKEFDEWKEEMEFDNYENVVDLIWTNVCSMIKFEEITEVWDEWILSLES